MVEVLVSLTLWCIHSLDTPAKTFLTWGNIRFRVEATYALAKINQCPLPYTQEGPLLAVGRTREIPFTPRATCMEKGKEAGTGKART